MSNIIFIPSFCELSRVIYYEQPYRSKKQFKLYLSLTAQEQLVLRTLAVCSQYIGQTVLRKTLARFSGDSSFEKLCSTHKLDLIFSPSFRDLLISHKLIVVNHKGVALSKYLIHVLTMQCVQDGTLPVIVEHIESIVPAKIESSWGEPSFNCPVRYFHNNLYLGKFDNLDKGIL